MIIEKRKDVENVRKTPKNALLADDGETLSSKLTQGKINGSEYQNEWVKNKGHKNWSEYLKYSIEEKRKNNISPKNCMWTRDEMIELYHEQNLKPIQIGKLHNPQVGHVAISRWIDIFGIEKKTLLADDGESLNYKRLKGEISPIEYENERIKNKGHKNYNEYRKHLIEEKRKNNILPENCIWSREKIEDLYAYDKQNLTPRQIGKMHNPQVSYVTILRWIDEFEIEKKTQSKATSGKNSGNWQGGISNEPYNIGFKYRLKEQVREYWYRKCVLCGFPEKNYGIKLSVHHVDYNKNQNGTSIEWKLVPLCVNCHVLTNDNRSYYEYIFTNFIKIRKTLEEFEWEIDYKSIGLMDEFEDDKIEYIRETLEEFNNNIHWRSLRI